MSKISFYLTNPKTKNETPLFSLINYGLFSIEDGKKKYLPLKYYTNIVILPGLWNKDLNRAKESIKWADDKAFDISTQAVKDSAKKNYEAINSKIENSKLVVFKNGNHTAMFSNKKEFRNLVLNFLM